MKITLSILLFTLVSISYSQELKIEKSNFYNGDIQVKRLSDFIELMNSNQEASELALKAKPGLDFGGGLGFVSGVIIGWTVVDGIMKEDMNWEYIGVGGGIGLFAILLQVSSMKKLKNAVSIFNTDKLKTSSLDLNVSNRGIGLSYTF